MDAWRKRQPSRREDRGGRARRWRAKILSTSRRSERLARLPRGRQPDRRQPVSEHRVEDVDHLPIAVIGTGELAPHALHRGRQHPVLERCIVAQGAGLASQHGHVVPRVVDRPLRSNERGCEDWAARKPKAIAQVDRMLESAGLTADAVTAQPLCENLGAIRTMEAA
jgi:hypothetical protein